MPDAWARPELRKWSGHNPEEWGEFKRKYFDELLGKPEVIQMLTGIICGKPVVTFLFTAHDKEHNGAVALKIFLDNKDTRLPKSVHSGYKSFHR
jgi:uncharacterized protein YeaO (DUF488 family)